MGMAPVTATPSDALPRFLLFVPVTLCSTGLEVLVPKERMLPSGGVTMIPMNWKLNLSLGHSGLVMPLNQQVEKGFTVLLA